MVRTFTILIFRFLTRANLIEVSASSCQATDALTLIYQKWEGNNDKIP